MKLPLTNADYERALKKGNLLGLRCQRCGVTYATPRAVCSECRSRNLEIMELKAQVKVYSYTVIRFPPKNLASDAPIGVAIIELADGARILGRLLDIGPEQIKVGMEVKGIKPIEADGRVAVGFVPLSHKNEH